MRDQHFALTSFLVTALVCGCTDSKPKPVDVARGGQLIANASMPSSSRPAADTTSVIRANYVEATSATAVEPPSLLAESSAMHSSGDTGHEDATKNLVGAIDAFKTKLAVISHNMANDQTVAFKRKRVVFEECNFRQVKLPGAQDAFNNYASTGVAIGLGTRVQGTQTIFDQGPIEVTNNPYDLAIDGIGFFQVIDPTTNNFIYTRAGNFAVNSNGILVIGSSNTGRVVQPQISIPVDTVAMVVSAEGNVSIQQFGQTQFSQIGQLQLAKFLNQQGLLQIGENLYQQTLASGEAVFGAPGTDGLGTIHQNALELSNVDLDDELREWQTTERTLKCLQRLVGAPLR